MNEKDISRFKRELSFNQVYKEGFQKGKLQAKKEELEWLQHWYSICTYKSTFKDNWVEIRIKQLQKEIGEEKGK